MKEYPRVEIEQEEFNVYVVKYEAFFYREILKAFPYGYDSDEPKLAEAIAQANEFKKNYKVETDWE